MKIWAIGDLHLDHTKDKAMDVFGPQWQDHDETILTHWRELVAEEDLVLVPGDISWALKWEEALEDLQFINDLPGHKVLSKGNHDYWWSGLTKMNNAGFSRISFVQNSSITFQNLGICGTRGWIAPDAIQFNEDDERIYRREVLRLELALNSLPKGIEKKIVMIHYPPFMQSFEGSPFTRLMEEHGVDLCVYGHLHGEGHKYVVEKIEGGVEYLCVSADYIRFIPREVEV